MHHIARDVGEAEVASGVAIGQSFVVDAEQVQHRRVQIVDARTVLRGAESEVVRRSMHGAAADTATGIEIGLLLNFGAPQLEFKRKHRTYRPKAEGQELIL